jgi:MoxR-like ATPase
MFGEFQQAQQTLDYVRFGCYVSPVAAPGVSVEASLPAAEGLLVDFARLVSQGQSDEALDRLQRIVGTTRGRRTAALTEGGRAALSLVLSERRSKAAGPVRSAFRTASAKQRAAAEEASLRTPVLSSEAAEEIGRVISEYERADELASLGLAPTRTILLSGPPGIGKTMTMQHLASALGLPLVRIEPSDVIGSYLGESARSLVDAFSAARSAGAVLGLDEIDALAKRRDDTQDVGEFKRFVSTLLLELDRWDGDAPVVAATNHLELLDPALDRRFELHVRLDLPGVEERERIIDAVCSDFQMRLTSPILAALVALSERLTGAAIAQRIERAARRVVLEETPADFALLSSMGKHRVDNHADRARIAAVARDSAGMTLRQVGDLLDCSHTAARRLAESGRHSPTSRSKQ